MGLIAMIMVCLLLMLAVMDIGEYRDQREQMQEYELSDISVRRDTNMNMDEVNKAIHTWLEYEDSNKYDEDKVLDVIHARITVREAFRSGALLIDPKSFDTNSATECYTAIQRAKEERDDKN